MKTGLRISYSILLSLFITNVYASEANFSCKDKIRLESGSVLQEDVPSGYKPLVSNAINRLTGVSVFDGPPQEGAVLQPSSITQKGSQLKWVFEGSYEKGKWFSCDYAGGLIRLIQQIPDSASTCVATVKKVKPHNTLDGAISCK